MITLRWRGTSDDVRPSRRPVPASERCHMPRHIRRSEQVRPKHRCLMMTLHSLPTRQSSGSLSHIQNPAWPFGDRRGAGQFGPAWQARARALWIVMPIDHSPTSPVSGCWIFERSGRTPMPGSRLSPTRTSPAPVGKRQLLRYMVVGVLARCNVAGGHRPLARWQRREDTLNSPLTKSVLLDSV